MFQRENPVTSVTEMVARNSGNQRKAKADPSPVQGARGEKQKEQHGALQPAFDLSGRNSARFKEKCRAMASPLRDNSGKERLR